MKKINILFVVIALLIGLVSCEKKEDDTFYYEDVDQGDMNLFYRHSTGGIGDVMPYYDNGVWNIFYLHDSAPNPGFHPWYRLSTTDFVNYEDHGEVVPVVHDISHQELALGTGSVIEKDSIYYAYYTQHNGRLSPKEKIAYSTSNDGMKTWEKNTDNIIDPRDYGFDTNDFRDPEVVFIPEQNRYIMLFTTRYLGKGAVGYLVSDDLVVWEKEDNGIFFLNNNINGTNDVSSNLECPTLVYLDGYWYLTFSDQWPTRVTHYVYTDDLNKDFIKPSNNVFDGAGLYAGKIASDGDRIVLMGWVSSNFNRQREFAWGGNLIAHEVRQLANGELYVEVLNELKASISHRTKLQIVDSNINSESDELISFNAKENISYVAFDELKGINRITGTMDIKDSVDTLGIFFDFFENESSFYYEIDPINNEMSYNQGSFTSSVPKKKYTSNSFYNTSNKLNFSILFEEGINSDGTIVSLYIEGQRVLTGRMQLTYGVNFGFYSKNSDVEFRNIKLYR